MIGIYEDAPKFYSGVELSGADLNTLRQNAIFLDAIEQQPKYAFTQGIERESVEFMRQNIITGEMPKVWWGGIQYRSAFDNLVIKFWSRLTANERLRVFVNPVEEEITDVNNPGTLVYEYTLINDETKIHTIDISGWDYPDGQILQITLQIYFPTTQTTKTGAYRVYDVYMENIGNVTVSKMGTYVAPSTFTESNIPELKLNTLSNAQDWLFQRLCDIPRVPFINGMFVNGTHKTTPTNVHVIYHGYVTPLPSMKIFEADIDFYSFNGEECIRILINNVIRYTSPMVSNGQTGKFTISVDLSDLAANTSYTVKIEHVVTMGKGGHVRELALYGSAVVNSRFVINYIRMNGARSYQNLQAELEPMQSVGYPALQSRMNSIVNAVTAVRTRMLATAWYNRAYAFRGKVGIDIHQNTVLDNESLPTMQRIGNRFVVAGRDVKIAWGGFSLTKSLTAEPEVNDVFEFANVETLIGTDRIQVVEGSLDKFDGLFTGMQYWLLGKDLIYYSEFLR